MGGGVGEEGRAVGGGGLTRHYRIEMSVSVTLAVSSASTGHLGHGEKWAYRLLTERRSHYTDVKDCLRIGERDEK